MTQQAGWYDDPEDDAMFRYWDGVQWTNHNAPKQKPNLDRAGQQQGYGQQGQEPGKIGWGPSAMRALIYQGVGVISQLTTALNVLGLFNLINVLWPLWDSKKQAIHDKVAKTNVVKIR